MRRLLAAAVFVVSGAFGCAGTPPPVASAPSTPAPPPPIAALPTEPHLANLRQLTFGGENAEAYWSFDGKELVFQSRRGDQDCDQEYVMRPDGTNVRMVSTGRGVVTCGYFFPDGSRVLYASTHESMGPSCPPKPDRSQGYVWPLYDYQLYTCLLYTSPSPRDRG